MSAGDLPPAPLPGTDLPTSILDYRGVALALLLGLPLAALTAWALARRRRTADATVAQAWRRSLAEVGLLFGIAPVLWITLLPGPEAGTASGNLSLTPLQDLLTMPTIEVVGNLLILAPVGLFAPVRFAAFASFPRVVALAALSSTLIETAQHVFVLDRVSSVDDVLLNAAGAGLAALASRRWWHRAPPSQDAARSAKVRPASSGERAPERTGWAAVQDQPH